MTGRDQPIICPGCELMIRLCECDETPELKLPTPPTGFQPGQKARWRRYDRTTGTASHIDVEVMQLRGDRVKVSTDKRRRPVWVKAHNLEAS